MQDADGGQAAVCPIVQGPVQGGAVDFLGPGPSGTGADDLDCMAGVKAVVRGEKWLPRVMVVARPVVQKHQILVFLPKGGCMKIFTVILKGWVRLR